MKKFLLVLLALMLPFCVALAEDGETWVDTSNVPELPGGTLTASLVSFTSNHTYPVYAAPGQQEPSRRRGTGACEHQWLDTGVWQRRRLDSGPIRHHRYAQPHRIY